jgi:hypothetical protein
MRRGCVNHRMPAHDAAEQMLLLASSILHCFVAHKKIFNRDRYVLFAKSCINDGIFKMKFLKENPWAVLIILTEMNYGRLTSFFQIEKSSLNSISLRLNTTPYNEMNKPYFPTLLAAD